MVKKLEKLKDKLRLTPSFLSSHIKNFKGGLTMLVFIGFVLFPMFQENISFVGIIYNIMIYAIFAASWDFLGGFSGQVSFGHVMFFGISGFWCATFMNYLNTPWWLSVLLAGVMMAILAFVLGLPLMRMHGPYFALGTMAISTIIQRIWMLSQLEPITGGLTGISVNPIPGNTVQVYYYIMLFMIISIIVMIAIGKSKTGTIFKSIRDDHIASKASGINTTKYKIYALMISGFFAGIAGGLYVLRIGNVNSSLFLPSESFKPIIMVMIGGLATISGAMLGAFIFFFIENLLKSLPDLAFFAQNEFLVDIIINVQLIAFAVIVIIIVRFAPNGILQPTIQKLKKLWDLLMGK